MILRNQQILTTTEDENLQYFSLLSTKIRLADDTKIRLADDTQNPANSYDYSRRKFAIFFFTFHENKACR